jgi:hypothetical protein
MIKSTKGELHEFSPEERHWFFQDLKDAFDGLCDRHNIEVPDFVMFIESDSVHVCGNTETLEKAVQVASVGHARLVAEIKKE